MSKYYAFRYSIVDLPQTSLFSPEDKNAWMSKFLHDDLMNNGYFQYNPDESKSKRNYIINYYEKYDEIVICKFARNAKIKRRVMDPSKRTIIEEKIKDIPFIFLFFDTKRQIVFIQNNTTVFQINSAASALMNLLNHLFKENGIEISINPLLVKDTFWEYVNKLNKIYSIEFNLCKPNNIGEFLTAKKLYSYLKQAINSARVDVGFHNSQGELKPVQDVLGDYVEYSEKGGGSYSLIGEINGEQKTFTSQEEDNIKSLNIEFSEKERIFDVVRKIHDFNDIVK